MNYSIILLGATISVSLFIRICVVCGAMEVSSIKTEERDDALWEIADHDDYIYGWLNGDPSYYFRSTLKKILTPEYSDMDEDEMDKFIRQMAKDHLQVRPQPDIALKNIPRIPFFDEDFYQEQICGSKPKNQSEEHPEDIIKDDELPDGCEYRKDETFLVCNAPTIKRIPTLPLQLQQFDLSLSEIERIDKPDFGDVSIRTIRLLQNSNLNVIAPRAFERVQDLTTLSIINNKLEFLSYEIYGGLNEVVSLFLDYNRISLLIYKNCTFRNENEIETVLPKLIYFSLKGNPLRSIPQQMWAGLRDSPLKHLDLGYCLLEEIHEDSFSYLRSLEFLDLTENPLLMPRLAEALKGLKYNTLKILSLGSNDLRSIPQDALSVVAASLQTLDLNSNSFEFITEGSIANTIMPMLIGLNLANCRINIIEPGTLELMPNLVNLDLRDNRLLQLSPSISSLIKLKNLNLDSNGQPTDGTGQTITTFSIPVDAFKNLTSLESLSLNNVPLRHIKKYTFTGATNLVYLILSNANLETIEDGSFSNLTNLSKLQMENNPTLQSINSHTFLGLEKLTYLKMNNCSLNFPSRSEDNGTDYIPLDLPDQSDPFAFMHALTWLELSNNKIEHIPKLSKNPNLSTLDLSGNKIESWENPLFKANLSNGRQRTLSMSENKLGFITEEMINDIIKYQPNSIDLSGNTFMCDKGACQLRDLINPPENAEKQILPLYVNWTNKEDYKCSNSSIGIGYNYHIVNITNEVCDSFQYDLPSPSPSSPPSSSSVVTIAVSIVCVTAFIAAATVFGYKKRVHLKYMWFVVKFKLPGKSETSLVEVLKYDYDIFISYHNGDRNFIQDHFLPEVEESITYDKMMDVEKWESKGLRVCLHERDFEAGMPITENIVEAVDRSRKIVIVVSKKYLESQWCTFEMNLAYHRLVESRRKAFLLILLEEIPINLNTKVLNYLMKSRTYLEWPGDNAPAHELKRFWSRLKSSLVLVKSDDSSIC